MTAKDEVEELLQSDVISSSPLLRKRFASFCAKEAHSACKKAGIRTDIIGSLPKRSCCFRPPDNPNAKINAAEIEAARHYAQHMTEVSAVWVDHHSSVSDKDLDLYFTSSAANYAVLAIATSAAYAVLSKANGASAEVTRIAALAAGDNAKSAALIRQATKIRELLAGN